jgi:hypothetical protein
MLVKINPSLGTSNNTSYLWSYNFMRCIDAIVTASAGSTPSVNPLTAANTYDTSVNLITSVISNTEAGGWTRSSSFNLVDASYTSSKFDDGSYRADYYNSTGKSVYPYKKFTLKPQNGTTWTSYPYLDFIYGIHTATDYSGTSGYAYNGFDAATTSFNICESGSPGYQTWYNCFPLYVATGRSGTTGTASVNYQEYLTAATQDYVIIMNPFNSILYAGLRTTQAWENSYNNNPPVVGWCYNVYPYYSWSYQANTKFMWALTMDGTGTVRTTPAKATNYITGADNNYVSVTGHTVVHGSGNVGIQSLKPVGDITGAPIIRSCTISNTANGSPGYRQPPVVDSTGTLVPPAVPINMMLAHQSTVSAYTFFNAGGQCLGIYKSLGGSDSYMNNYYTSTSQTFTVGSDSYVPYVVGPDTLYRDMFLVRKA